MKLKLKILFSLRWKTADPIIALDIVAEPANKAATFGVSNFLMMMGNHRYRSGITSVEMLDENVNNIYVGLAYKPFCPYYNVLNDKTLKLVEAGLINLWQRRQKPQRNDMKIEDVGPQVLTMEHLEFGFLICLISLAFGFAAFVVELLIKPVKQLSFRLLNHGLTLLLVNAFKKSLRGTR